MTYCSSIRYFQGVGDGDHQDDQRIMVDAIRTLKHHQNQDPLSHHTCGKCISMDEGDSSSSSSCSSCASLPSLPQDVQELCKTLTAECYCPLLQNAKIPSSVFKIDWMAFYQFSSLVEVSFCSSSRLKEISSCAFMDCRSLQVVSLPDTIEQIAYGAFGSCVNLTTVAISPSHKGLRIKAFAFRKCESLSNIDISPSSCVIDQRAFEGCTRLQECLGRLKGRFERFPIHKLLYQAASTTVVEELHKTICGGDDEEPPLADMFGMTPFHVLSSSAEPRRDWFQVLLKAYPPRILGWKDANGKRAMDYLAINFTPKTASLLEMALQVWMFGPLERWGATRWSIDMKDQVNSLLVNHNIMEERTKLLRKACSQMEDYTRNETMTVLELAVWKKELTEDGTKVINEKDRQQRTTALNVCGSCCVLSNVAPFLDIVARG